MSVKLIVIVAVIIFVLFLLASYTRLINIDGIIRRHEKQLQPKSIIVYDLDQAFNYGSNGRFMINDNSLRVYSSCIPPVVLHLTVATDGGHIIASDGAGNQFLLGRIESTQIKDNSTYYTVSFQVSDKITYKTSYSLVPYYYGFYVLSPGPISRYYHYYSFAIENESGASLLLEWKFSTYKGKDGKLIPDLFGDNKEGLINVVIKKK